MKESNKRGVHLVFVATVRDVDSYLKSDLHHWVRHDIEKKTNLTAAAERFVLKDLLRARYESHQEGMKRFSSKLFPITRLDLHNQAEWVPKLSVVEQKFSWQSTSDCRNTK